MKSINANLRYPWSWKMLYRVVLVLAIGLFFSSCEMENVLDKEPTEGFSDAAIWEDENLTKAAAFYTYKLMPFGFQREDQQFFPYSNFSDETNARNSTSTLGVIISGEHSPFYSGPMNVWTARRNYWDPISQANKFLANIDGSTIDDAELKAQLTAEVRALRAYAYFMLISHYGGVPLITTPFSLDDDFKVERSSYDEVMNFILSELNEIISSDVLPLSYGEPGRITLGAAMTIKSRALLYAASPLNNPENDQQKWQTAADAAKAVIDMGVYSLANDYQFLFMEGGGYSTPEVIWGRPMNIDIELEATLERRIFPNGWGGYGNVHPLQNLVDDFETLNGLQPEDDPSYDPQNPYVNRDPRFYATILYNGAPFKERTIETFLPGGLDTSDGINSPWNATETGYYMRKFIDESKCACNSSASGSSSPTWIYFRYAEILLNYAEAKYMLGDEATAREYINMVRSRSSVDMPPITESGDALFERIVNERRIELVFEEHRWFDVRRWMIAVEVLSEPRQKILINKDPETGEITYNVETYWNTKFNEWNYLAPIPQEVIDQNSEIQQNPGY